MSLHSDNLGGGLDKQMNGGQAATPDLNNTALFFEPVIENPRINLAEQADPLMDTNGTLSFRFPVNDAGPLHPMQALQTPMDPLPSSKFSHLKAEKATNVNKATFHQKMNPKAAQSDDDDIQFLGEFQRLPGGALKRIYRAAYPKAAQSDDDDIQFLGEFQRLPGGILKQIYRPAMPKAVADVPQSQQSQQSQVRTQQSQQPLQGQTGAQQSQMRAPVSQQSWQGQSRTPQGQQSGQGQVETPRNQKYLPPQVRAPQDLHSPQSQVGAPTGRQSHEVQLEVAPGQQSQPGQVKAVPEPDDYLDMPVLSPQAGPSYVLQGENTSCSSDSDSLSDLFIPIRVPKRKAAELESERSDNKTKSQTPTPPRRSLPKRKARNVTSYAE